MIEKILHRITPCIGFVLFLAAPSVLLSVTGRISGAWKGIFVSGSHTGTNDTQKDQITAKKQVTFYHTYGYKKGGTWVVPMRAWVHEPADIVRRIAARVVMEAMEEKQVWTN